MLGYIAERKAVYLTQLVSFVGLAVLAMIVFAAVVALMDVNKSFAFFGALFGIASKVIALALGSSPQSLRGGLVILSDACAAAGTAAERAGLVARRMR